MPLFFFVSHFRLLHALAVVAALVTYGRAASAFLWMPLPSRRADGSRHDRAANFRFGIWNAQAIATSLSLLRFQFRIDLAVPRLSPYIFARRTSVSRAISDCN